MRMWMLAIGLIGCTTDAEVVQRLALDDVLDTNSEITGVDVDDDGALIVSTLIDGVWRIDEGEATQLVSQQQLLEAFVPGTITDVAALGDGRYAMTVPGIGVLFDANDNSVTQHFCYEPGEWGDWEVQRQETHSLAYDPATDRLISQPQTLTEDTVDRTDVAEFDQITGEPLEWHTLNDDDFLASALAVTPEGVVLAEGSEIYDYALGDDTPDRRLDLKRIGVGDIEGLAYIDGQLLVLDGAKRELVWVQGW